jgi:transcriptional regulator with XRE-family HTH domain
MSRTPHSASNLIDQYVGARVRNRRLRLGVSQSALAQTLGLTFQQVQKYERGDNRISASKLYEIARTLKVDVGYFFEDAPALERAVDANKDPIRRLELDPDGLEFAQLFGDLEASYRPAVLALMRSLVAVRR